MSDKQQSAVDFLVEELSRQNRLYTKEEIINIAKELFKQQIIEAHAVGRIKECSGINTDGYQYFNETFKTESNGNSI